MEASSIVSFNNDSDNQPFKDDSNQLNVYELALHAMRDRCLLLQKRITSLESDNMQLKLNIHNHDNSSFGSKQDKDVIVMQQKIAELNKQKSQLMHHVYMVSCENKSLWSKISNLKSLDRLHNYSVGNTNNLNESIYKNIEGYQEKYLEPSLEEISLKLINSYIQEKSQLIEQYEQMTQLQESELLNVDSIGFAFLDDHLTDSLKEMYSEMEILQQLKKELAQQEKDLKMIVNKLESCKKVGWKCSSCATNNSKVTVLEHKEIETSDSLTNWATPQDSSNYVGDTSIQKVYSNVAEDIIGKICPMCGELFDNNVDFAEFQTHVENHFIADRDSDSSIKNDSLSQR